MRRRGSGSCLVVYRVVNTATIVHRKPLQGDAWGCLTRESVLVTQQGYYRRTIFVMRKSFAEFRE
ncbi:MAG: hypothetical protein BROFUL_03335 [Candidatus Brocadia fulgida]|uniref:Uncharacterized protein n=1 Tax=Candidatus Brocadia fulgida TaxID=380242 RepID=A0A0M2UPA8_9BACT|nr:MAG: hypothetical protein BROFUL_03335 [Candidatus Brocadia fulgida]